jgi:hypothetical protein
MQTLYIMISRFHSTAMSDFDFLGIHALQQDIFSRRRLVADVSGSVRGMGLLGRGGTCFMLTLQRHEMFVAKPVCNRVI